MGGKTLERGRVGEELALIPVGLDISINYVTQLIHCYRVSRIKAVVNHGGKGPVIALDFPQLGP